MKRQAGTNAAFAAALCGMLPVLYRTNIIFFILTMISIAILILSALILVFHDKSSSRFWKWLIKRVSSIEVEYVSTGLGLASTGLNLILLWNPWVWIGLPMFLLGGFFIGGQIGKGINLMIKSHKKRMNK